MLTRSIPNKFRGLGLAALLLGIGESAWGASQTIEFDPIPNQIFGGSPFPVAAQASSGLPVSLVSKTPAVCKNSANLVMLLSAGTCSLTASQSGNTFYAAATPVTRSFTVSLAKPSGTLVAAPGSPFAVGDGPYSVAVGDFNGDGIQDLAIPNYEGSSVTVLLGNGKGGFTQAAGSPFATEASPASAAVGDFNGDGNQDLAVANETGTVTVLLGDGTGGFRPTLSSPIMAGSAPYSIVVGDFNGDGIQDLAVANANLSVNTVTVLLGDGAGGFSAAPDSPFAVGETPLCVVVGDFNGDGIQDLATANFYYDNTTGLSTGTVTVLVGNGSGGFTPALGSPFSVGTGAQSIAVGDFNRDGIQDLVTANYQLNGVTVLLGNGRGGFTEAPGSPFAVGLGAGSVVVGDFNGDGIPDLAAAGLVLLGNGSGGFTVPAGGGYFEGSSITVGDLNGDGVPDLVGVDNFFDDATVLLGAKAATSSALSTTSPLTVAQGQPVPLTLTVSDSTAAFDAPTGAVTFSDGATSLGTASQTASPYTFSTSSLAVGSHTLSATYGGDTRSLGSVSNPITVQVISPPANLPVINQSGGVVNGASFQPGIESGSWVTIQGTDLSNTNPGRTWLPSEIVDGNLPTSLDGTSVTIDGKPAFVYYISPTQLNVQAATDSATGSVQVVVTNNGQVSAPVAAQLQTYSPAFFLYTGTSYAIASLYPSYALVGNPNAIPGTVAARPGDILILWATGFGPTNPATPAGIAVVTASSVATQPTVMIGGAPVTVLSAVISPGSAGLYQIAIQLPADVPTGAVAIQASVNGVQSPSAVLTFVAGQ